MNAGIYHIWENAQSLWQATSICILGSKNEGNHFIQFQTFFWTTCSYFFVWRYPSLIYPSPILFRPPSFLFTWIHPFAASTLFIQNTYLLVQWVLWFTAPPIVQLYCLYNNVILISNDSFTSNTKWRKKIYIYHIYQCRNFGSIVTCPNT